ncbi:hypothetical protein CBM2586_B90206 [Cupriavidus phytorum]|uniref:Uncharacterized protein n=1 Tax=Cupriavidus taiwanensis TaxID=164546 RepID=A0A375CN38_9BURK|nr:hypothetical protein CBM2586_B90206 [Cupriavidus taiwanensis]
MPIVVFGSHTPTSNFLTMVVRHVLAEHSEGLLLQLSKGAPCQL